MRPNWDIDIFWHIKVGEWIVEHRELPRTDIFSATDPSRPWTPFQWAYEVLVYEVYTDLGFVWVRVLHGAVFLAAFACMYRLFRRYMPGRSAAIFLSLLALALAEDRLRVRPEAFNFLFTALFMPLFLAPAGTRLRAGTVALAVVGSVVWASVHAGGALLLPLAAAALFCGRVVSHLAARSAAGGSSQHAPGQSGAASPGVRREALILAATALPMPLVPGFLGGVWSALTMLDASAILIPEWHPPAVYFMPDLAGELTAHHVFCGLTPYLVFLAMAVIASLGLVRAGWKRFVLERDLGLLAAVLVFLVLAAKSARFIYLDAFAILAFVVPYRKEVARLVTPLAGRAAMVAAACVLAMNSYQYSIVQQRHGLARAIESAGQDLEPRTFPEAASDVIEAMGLTGRFFHYTQWGGYLIFRHYPRSTVFSDGRGNFTIEERDALVQTHRPFEREEALERAWSRYDFDIVVFPPPVFPLLAWDREKWMLVYRDDIAEVFLRLSPRNSRNAMAVMDYWGRRGLDAGQGPSALQDEYIRILGTEYLARPEVLGILARANQGAAASDDVRVRGPALYERGMTFFTAARWDDAAESFRGVLALVPRHSTAALYLAWSLYLKGDRDGAAHALAENFLNPAMLERRDSGRLGWAGMKILGLLARKVGIAPVNGP